jgi:predicted HTH transcriptional regulator
MSHSLASLAQLITDNAFDLLIGERESEHLDAKEQPYHFATNGNHARRELAKDITSFANVNGGYIIIGLTATQDPLHPTEQITALRSRIDSGTRSRPRPSRSSMEVRAPNLD